MDGMRPFGIAESIVCQHPLLDAVLLHRETDRVAIHEPVMDCNTTSFTVQQNSVEKWVLTNNGFGDPKWTHPIHIHFEEFQILQGAPGLIGSADSRYYYQNDNQSTGVNLSRKDVDRIIPSQ